MMLPIYEALELRNVPGFAGIPGIQVAASLRMCCLAKAKALLRISVQGFGVPQGSPRPDGRGYEFHSSSFSLVPASFSSESIGRKLATVTMREVRTGCSSVPM